MIHATVRVLGGPVKIFRLQCEVLPRSGETVYIGEEEFVVTRVVHEFTLGMGTETSGGDQKVMLVVSSARG